MNNGIIHTENYKGFTIEIFEDEYFDSTLMTSNEDAFIVCTKNRDFSPVNPKKYTTDEITEEITKTKKYFFEGYYVFPLYAYIHSGVALSLGNSSYPFTCKWDSGLIGYVLIKRVPKWSYKKETARNIASGVVEDWNSILSGETYGYSVKNELTGFEDSCWGFIGDFKKSGIIECAKDVINAEITSKAENYAKQLELSF